METFMPMTSNEVQFKRVSLDSLEGHPSNYLEHPPAQIADLKASLMRYKQVRPVVVQRTANDGQYIILAGHGITTAAKELYAENPQKYSHLNDWGIAIVDDSWSISMAKGYMVSDNELGRKAVPDELSLAALLDEQRNAGFDLASLGTDEESLRQMLESLGDGYLGNGASDEEDSEPPAFKEYDESIADDLDTEMCEDCGKLCVKSGGKKKDA
jgi:ParB-like nuclease domain